MEDALAHANFLVIFLGISVLILVVMEDALARCKSNCNREKRVLILVVMEDALAHFQ